MTLVKLRYDSHFHFNDLAILDSLEIDDRES